MDGIQFFQLADVVGLKQAAIARHFAVTRNQVYRWAHEQRPIPQRYHAELVHLLYNAVREVLGPHHAWYLRQAAGDVSAEAALPLSELSHLAERQHIALCFFELFIAHMAERGRGPADYLADVLQQAADYASGDAEVLEKPEHLERLAELGRRLTETAELQLRFGPLLPLVEKDPAATL